MLALGIKRGLHVSQNDVTGHPADCVVLGESRLNLHACAGHQTLGLHVGQDVAGRPADGTAVTDVRDAINSFADQLGVSASLSANADDVVINSQAFGGDSFVRVKELNDGTTDGSGGTFIGNEARDRKSVV